MNVKPKIAIIEDDREIRVLLQDYLQRNDFRVQAFDGGAAFDRHCAAFGKPDLVILDLMLPGEDGLSICRRIRSSSRVPVLILTAKGEDIDRIIGLEIGADDYMAKPFNPREILARVKAILRRCEPPPVSHRRLAVLDLIVDLDARSVTSRTRGDIQLTSAEFDLLACLLSHPGRVLTRDQLMDWTRGRKADVFDRTIDVQLSRLRKKIEEEGEPLIKTVRNAGYLLCHSVREA
jgi:two-component system OmpR family response regulator